MQIALDVAWEPADTQGDPSVDNDDTHGSVDDEDPIDPEAMAEAKEALHAFFDNRKPTVFEFIEYLTGVVVAMRGVEVKR